MAKTFCTFDETKYKLNTIDDSVVKELVQDGDLREFRDGSKIIFKRDEVDDFIRERDKAVDQVVWDANSDNKIPNEIPLGEPQHGAELLKEVCPKPFKEKYLSGKKMRDALEADCPSTERRISINADGTITNPPLSFDKPPASFSPPKSEPVVSSELYNRLNALMEEQNQLLRKLISSVKAIHVSILTDK